MQRDPVGLTLVLLGVLVLVAAFLAYVAAKPGKFRISSEGPVTNITWSMTGCSSFLHKLFGTIFSMDKRVGGEFAK